MKKMKLSKLIKGKEEIVIKELGERLKDFAFMTAKDKISKSLEQLKDNKVSGEDYISITWNVDFIVNDVIQIVGRSKREEIKRIEDKEKK